MSLSVTGIVFLMFSVFLIAASGYALGCIKVKGISLGTSGVFITALIYGLFFANNLSTVFESSKTVVEFANSPIIYNIFKFIETLGLVFFVTSVGFIAGPNFFSNLKKNYKSYTVLAIVITFSGGLSCLLCYYFGLGFGGETNKSEFMAMMVGLLSGAITSTPAFSAAKDTVAPDLQNVVTVGYAIAYLFGVISIVLFVQIVPKITKADMKIEREKLVVPPSADKKEYRGKLFKLDKFGFFPFCSAVVIGVALGAVKIGGIFSLTTTGGVLLTALIFGHFGRIGCINLRIDNSVLNIFRELGLVFFLIGTGVSGGAAFVKYFEGIYFVYGIFMKMVPMFVGYFFAKYVLKFSILNNLGAISGGMTSTPALGTLINVAETDDVASAYAATYPVALILVVIISQILIIFF